MDNDYILTMASDLESLAELLNNEGINTSKLYIVSGNLKQNKILKYDIEPFKIEINNNEKFPKKLSHQKSATDLELFFDMKKDVTELKKMFLEILQNPALAGNAANYTKESLMQDFPILANQEFQQTNISQPQIIPTYAPQNTQPVILNNDNIHHHEEVEESLNIIDKEKELIIKALKKHKGRRKDDC